jgi:hypothetical protein
MSVHMSVFISIMSGRHKRFVQIKNHAFPTVSPTPKPRKGIPWMVSAGDAQRFLLLVCCSVLFCPVLSQVSICRCTEAMERSSTDCGNSETSSFLPTAVFPSGLWKRVKRACNQVATTVKARRAERQRRKYDGEKRNSPTEMGKGSIRGLGIEEGERLASHRDRL